MEPLEARTLLAGEFTEINAGLPASTSGSTEWGDADNDGDLDILISGTGDGSYLAQILRNDGSSTFADANAGLTAVQLSSVVWGDMDNDGDLDVLVTGRDRATSTNIAKVFRNDGQNAFTDINAGLTGVQLSFAAWGDYDNDGDLDIVLTGSSTANGNIATVYRNNGNSTFTDINAGLLGVFRGSVAWGDYDKDGDLDILLTGLVAPNNIVSRVYRNEGNNTFTDINAGLPGVRNSSVAWGDYDADGDLDILLTGHNNSTEFARVYRNNGNDTFTDINAALTPVYYSSAAWGDYDNDGDLDILLSGKYGTRDSRSTVYRNDGNDTFTDLSPGFTGLYFGSTSWGDYDNDGDLDILLTGRDTDYGVRHATLYRNNVVTANTAPTAPTNLTSSFASATSLTLSWAAATDAQTASPGLSYNLRVGTTPGGSDVFATMADDDASGANGPNGYRRVAATGPIKGTNYTLQGLTPGATYYWSVQAIDTSFAGGAFAAEQSALPQVAPTLGGAVANQAVNDNATITPFSTLTVTDPNTQAMSAMIEIDSGTVRGDFTAASTVGWTRTVNGTDIRYSQTFSSTANIGATVQAAIRALVFQPRSNVVTPTTTETTGFTVTVTDGVAAPVTDSVTTVITTSVNDVPAIGGTAANQAVNDTATVAPFSAVTITDPDTQAMSALIQINNGTFRGDFSAASTVGWTRTVIGTAIRYTQTFSAATNIGATVQAAIRALVFQPRSNAIAPTTTESTNFTVTVTDGVATPVSDSATSVITTSVNNAPTMGGAVANQTVSESATINPFSTLTVTDPDTQNMFARVTILNGVVRGDFTAASATGWTRSAVGNNITYERYYNPAANIGATVQAAIRALVFQPRTGAINPGTNESTTFALYVTDGIGNAGNSTTSTITTTVNHAPTISGASANFAVNDNATVNPFNTLTVTDPDTQEMLARVTILNGAFRGDFTNAVSAGWTRSTLGNDIFYVRYFSPVANIGSVVQTAFRALVFQPRTNVITPGTTEATDFQVSVSDGVAPAVLDTGTRVTTQSAADMPVIGGAVANQAVNDDATIAPFTTLTVTDPDLQDMLARVTVTNGVNRGDFTTASVVGWSRNIVGNDIVYNRYFNPAANIGSAAQAAVRALIFQPRNNIPLNTTETTTFTVYVKDGSGYSGSNSTTSVIATGVAPRPAVASKAVASTFLDSDITTVVTPSVPKAVTNPLARLLKKSR